MMGALRDDQPEALSERIRLHEATIDRILDRLQPHIGTLDAFRGGLNRQGAPVDTVILEIGSSLVPRVRVMARFGKESGAVRNYDDVGALAPGFTDASELLDAIVRVGEEILPLVPEDSIRVEICAAALRASLVCYLEAPDDTLCMASFVRVARVRSGTPYVSPFFESIQAALRVAALQLADGESLVCAASANFAAMMSAHERLDLASSRARLPALSCAEFDAHIDSWSEDRVYLGAIAREGDLATFSLRYPFGATIMLVAVADLA